MTTNPVQRCRWCGDTITFLDTWGGHWCGDNSHVCSANTETTGHEPGVPMTTDNDRTANRAAETAAPEGTTSYVPAASDLLREQDAIRLERWSS